MAELTEWVPPRGGSDIMEEGLRRRIDFDEHRANLIVSRCQEELIDLDKKNILWQHLNYNEPLTMGMRNKYFLRSIDAFVYVSHWQYEKFRYVYSIPTENVFIIKNAIDPIEFRPRDRQDRFRLIYTSAPFRGLSLLLDSFELLGRDDVELDIYSSTIVYGTDYHNAYKNEYKNLFERAQNLNNVHYHGYVPNSDIIAALQRAHIYAYPSVFEETCCLAMIEAGAAGCSIVSHNLGAIYETASEFGRLLPIRVDQERMAHDFAQALNETIDSYWKNYDNLKVQSDFFNHYYAWDRKIEQWFDVLSTEAH